MSEELIGAELDAAVAECEGFPQCGLHTEDGETVCFLGPVAMERFIWAPSTAWEQGGPIIERERIEVSPASPRNTNPEYAWSAQAFLPEPHVSAHGPTPLIAAMRCFVASRRPT